VSERGTGLPERTGGPTATARVLRRIGITGLLLGPVLWLASGAAIRAVHAERLSGPFQQMMAGRDVHPVEHYLQLALPLRSSSAVALVASGLVASLLSVPSARSRAHRMLTGGREGTDRYWRPAALSVVIAAAALRLPGLGTTSLWLDEAIISMISVEGFTGMLGRIARDSSAAPAHHAIQASVFAVAPQTAAVARLPALIASMSTVVLLLATPRWGIPRGVAVAAALGIALSPAHVGFARDATQYATGITMGAILVIAGLVAFTGAREPGNPGASRVALPLAVAVTPWVAYPSVFVALALLAGLFAASLLLDGSAARGLRRSVVLSTFGLIVSGAAVYEAVARRQFRVLDNWYLAANYPSTSGVSPTVWAARSLDSFFAILGGGQLTGRWSGSSIDGFRAPILEGSALGWVILGVLLVGFLSAARAALRITVRDRPGGPDAPLLMMGIAILLVLGAIVAAALELYPFGGIHQQLHATPVLLLGAGSAAAHLLRGSSSPVRVALICGALVLFTASAVAALPTVYEEREDIVSAIVVGVDGRSGRGLAAIEDDRVWIYRAARPAVRFHFPERAFREFRSGPTDTEGMLAELESASDSDRVAVVFSQIYPHPEVGDHRRALQALLLEHGWIIEEEIHHPNTVTLVVRSP